MAILSVRRCPDASLSPFFVLCSVRPGILPPACPDFVTIYRPWYHRPPCHHYLSCLFVLLLSFWGPHYPLNASWSGFRVLGPGSVFRSLDTLGLGDRGGRCPGARGPGEGRRQAREQDRKPDSDRRKTFTIRIAVPSISAGGGTETISGGFPARLPSHPAAPWPVRISPLRLAGGIFTSRDPTQRDFVLTPSSRIGERVASARSNVHGAWPMVGA